MDRYLCGEEMRGEPVIPKHYEYFFDKWKLVKVLLILTALLLLGGAAPWL